MSADDYHPACSSGAAASAGSRSISTTGSGSPRAPPGSGETIAALRKAQIERDDRCTAAVGKVSVKQFERLFDAEQAKVDAIRAKIDAVIEQDKWPAHLYFSGI